MRPDMSPNPPATGRGKISANFSASHRINIVIERAAVPPELEQPSKCVCRGLRLISVTAPLHLFCSTVAKKRELEWK